MTGLTRIYLRNLQNIGFILLCRKEKLSLTWGPLHHSKTANQKQSKEYIMTKLLVTLGPSSLNSNTIQACDQKGIFLYRINLSHTNIDELEDRITEIRKYTDTNICLDSEGAQIRNQKMHDDEVIFKKSSVVTIHHEEIVGDEYNISFTPKGISTEFQVGDIIDIDFNSARLCVTENNTSYCKAEVINEGKIGSNKAADVNRDVSLNPITPKDEQAITIGKEMGILHYALSFASGKNDIEIMRQKIGDESYLISKIESMTALINLKDIIQLSDAILIDRGDLSRQLPIEKIPFLQRRIISSARARNTEVFVATNLLESMVTKVAPTRAEVNDVVSTLLMGASGLVLAAETAIGQYPVECVEMIHKLIEQYNRWTPDSNLDDILSV
jgi:pyruvate kinase